MTGCKVSLEAALLLFTACGAGAAADSGQSVTPPLTCSFYDAGPVDLPFSLVPIFESPGDAGSTPLGVRFAMQFGIGDAGLVDAFMDTGSYGIQLIQDAVPPAVIAALDTIGTASLTEEFEGGIEATGVIARASVTFGTLTTATPIQIFLIQKLACAKGFPCQSAPGSLQQSIFDGFPAIVGIGLRGASIAPGLGCPISQLPGQPAFIVKAPAFGGDAGVLRIGPTPEELSAYQTFQLGSDTTARAIADCVPVWNDSSIPGCVNDTSTSSEYCGNSVLDTGAPASLVEWQGCMGPEELPPGSSVQVTLGPPGALIGQWDVAVSANPEPGQDELFFLASTLGENLINVGTAIFFRYDVYFNQAQGQVGLLPH